MDRAFWLQRIDLREGLAGMGEYHYRSGSTKQELKGAALDAFLLKKHGLRWDGVPLPRFAAKDCSAQAFESFRRKAAKSGRIDEAALKASDFEILENLQLLEGNYLKRAAALLFYDKPEKFVSGAFIKIAYFSSEADLAYQDEVQGNLFLQADKTIELLTSKYLKAFISYEGVQRVERFLFPLPALREALFNAIVHKDYSSGIPIQIRVYADRISIWNSGRLPEDWPLARLQASHSSIPFNPLIANTFFRVGLIESWGRGIEKINQACKLHGIGKPGYKQDLSGLIITFKASLKQVKFAEKLYIPEKSSEKLLKASEEIGETSEKSLKISEKIEEPSKKIQKNPYSDRKNYTKNIENTLEKEPETSEKSTLKASEKKSTSSEKISEKTSEKIVILLRQNQSLTTQEMATALGKTRRAIEMQINKLKAQGILERIGPDKGGHWRVNRD
jgi:ATP-dependent DNA helicase RecG